MPWPRSASAGRDAAWRVPRTRRRSRGRPPCPRASAAGRTRGPPPRSPSTTVSTSQPRADAATAALRGPSRAVRIAVAFSTVLPTCPLGKLPPPGVRNSAPGRGRSSTSFSAPTRSAPDGERPRGSEHLEGAGRPRHSARARGEHQHRDPDRHARDRSRDPRSTARDTCATPRAPRRACASRSARERHERGGGEERERGPHQTAPRARATLRSPARRAARRSRPPTGRTRAAPRRCARRGRARARSKPVGVSRHLDRRPERADAAAHGVLVLDDEAVRRDLRVREDVLEAVHAAGRDVVRSSSAIQCSQVSVRKISLSTRTTSARCCDARRLVAKRGSVSRSSRPSAAHSRL